MTPRVIASSYTGNYMWVCVCLHVSMHTLADVFPKLNLSSSDCFGLLENRSQNKGLPPYGTALCSIYNKHPWSWGDHSYGGCMKNALDLACMTSHPSYGTGKHEALLLWNVEVLKYFKGNSKTLQAKVRDSLLRNLVKMDHIHIMRTQWNAGQFPISQHPWTHVNSSLLCGLIVSLILITFLAHT